MLTPKQFAARADLARLKVGTAARNGAQLVLVDGLTVYAAAQQLGVSHQPIYRSVSACNESVENARQEIAYLQNLINESR